MMLGCEPLFQPFGRMRDRIGRCDARKSKSFRKGTLKNKGLEGLAAQKSMAA
jgi:hypothetical protein